LHGFSPCHRKIWKTKSRRGTPLNLQTCEGTVPTVCTTPGSRGAASRNGSGSKPKVSRIALRFSINSGGGVRRPRSQPTDSISASETDAVRVKPCAQLMGEDFHRCY